MKKMLKDGESKVWVTVVKLVVGLTVMIGGVGLALWYAKDMDNGSPTAPAGDAWGVSKDSPVRMKR